MGRAATLLAVLVLLEAVSAKVWSRLPVSGLERTCPRVAFLAGPLDPAGREALRETAFMAWIGMVRGVDLVLISLACASGMPRFVFLPEDGPTRSLRLGGGMVLGFALLTLLGQVVSGGRLLGYLRGVPDMAFTRPLAVGADLAVGVLLGPYVEEVLFRGVLLKALRDRFPPSGSILLSALLFALFHALAGQTWPVAQLAGGLAFAWLALETGGVLAPFLLHAAANGFVLALKVLA